MMLINEFHANLQITDIFMLICVFYANLQIANLQFALLVLHLHIGITTYQLQLYQHLPFYAIIYSSFVTGLWLFAKDE